MARSSRSAVSEEMEVSISTRVDYCCGVLQKFTPIALHCNGGGELCAIQPFTSYWSYEDEEHGRFTICESCWKGKKAAVIKVWNEIARDGVALKKDLFKRLENVEQIEEPVIVCTQCERKFHWICFLHNDRIWKTFRCHNCLEADSLSKMNHYTAKNLPRCELSEHLEDKLNNFLEGKDVNEKVEIRVLLSVGKESRVKPNFQELHQEVLVFPYQYKVIYAFQKIEGIDVAFFAFIVQEYGANCPPPNRGRVYLAYLDSVQYFRPRELRTLVYQEILLTYFEYMKRKGFESVHIWVCPPIATASQDYLFYCHPDEQKIPDLGRLQAWYGKLLQKAKDNGVIISYQDLMSYLIETEVKQIKEIPYFAGDLWPDIIEKLIPKFKNKRVPVSKPPAKRQRSFEYQMKKDVTEPVMIALIKEFVSYKKRFLVAKLNEEDLLEEDQDQEELISRCDMMDNRECFIDRSQKRHLEYSTLRRAKFSTFAILYEMLALPSEAIVCDQCGKEGLEDRYTCTLCKDFDVCVPCREQKLFHHPHPLVLQLKKKEESSGKKTQLLQIENNISSCETESVSSCETEPFSFSTEVEMNDENTPPSPLIQAPSRFVKMKWEQATEFLETISHAILCEGQCEIPERCDFAKKLLQHVNNCNKSGSCQICSTYANMTFTHIRFCPKREECAFCPMFKEELTLENLTVNEDVQVDKDK